VAAVPSIGRARAIEQASHAPGARLTERLYEHHYHRVFGFCLYQLRDRDEAADAAQTTFLHALRATRQGVVPVFEAPWLLAIARNVCRSRWDSGKRRGEVEFAHDPHGLAEIAAGREATDELLGLEQALASLAEPQRQAVLLRDWQGLSYQEVADHLGITVSSAESLIFRGRDALARALNGDDRRTDDTHKRRFGLSSLVSALKPGLLGGSVAAKVAAGAAVVAVGLGAGDSILRHDATPPPTPSPQVATSSARSGAAAGIGSGSRAPTTHHTRSARAPVAALLGGVPTHSTHVGSVVATPPATSTPPGTPSAAALEDRPASTPGTPPPATPAPETRDQPATTPVTTVPATVEPVIQTATDTAQTVVTTATSDITAVTDPVQAAVDSTTTAAPAAPTVTVTVTVPPLPVHVP
jgi:RNA polymerase sigma-70 factor (ECF subfamily)